MDWLAASLVSAVGCLTLPVAFSGAAAPTGLLFDPAAACLPLVASLPPTLELCATGWLLLVARGLFGAVGCGSLPPELDFCLSPGADALSTCL